MYIKTRNLADLVRTLEEKGYRLDPYNRSSSDAIGLYTYNDHNGTKTYGYLYEWLCTDDETTSWILHRKECKTTAEFVSGL